MASHRTESYTPYDLPGRQSHGTSRSSHLSEMLPVFAAIVLVSVILVMIYQSVA